MSNLETVGLGFGNLSSVKCNNGREVAVLRVCNRIWLKVGINWHAVSSCYGCHRLPSSDLKKHNSGHEWFLSLQILNIFQIVNNRVCDASIRSMLEEFQILNSIFRLYYEYHLDLCNELNCLSDFLKTSNLSKAIYCLIPNTDGLADRPKLGLGWTITQSFGKCQVLINLQGMVLHEKCRVQCL